MANYILIAQDMNNVWEVVAEGATMKEGREKAKGFIARGVAQKVRILQEKDVIE